MIMRTHQITLDFGTGQQSVDLGRTIQAMIDAIAQIRREFQIHGFGNVMPNGFMMTL